MGRCSPERVAGQQFSKDPESRNVLSIGSELSYDSYEHVQYVYQQQVRESGLTSL